jgi:methionyl-tRNA formyltransferase
MHEEESHETLNLKLQMAGGRLARQLAPSFAELWNAAQPQGAGEYWPVFSEAERTLNFHGKVTDALRMLRAFGVLECYGHLNGQRIYVRQAYGWPETHHLAPETVVHVNGSDVVLACSLPRRKLERSAYHKCEFSQYHKNNICPRLSIFTTSKIFFH